MPAWIHDRADRIREKNPSMPKSESFAIATQQSHAVGKSPKGYGTAKGHAEAKQKYKTPGDDSKTAMDAGLMSNLRSAAGAGPALRGQLTNVGQKLTGGAAGQVSSAARRGTLLQNAPAPKPMIRPLAVEKDPFAKVAFLNAFLDEFEKISKEKDSGFFDAAKNLLTTPISGTPELFGGVKNSIGQATRGGMAGKGGPSAGFQKFQQQRAAGMTPKVAFSTNAYSGPMNPGFPTGASMLPPFKKPSPMSGPLGKTAEQFKLEGDAVIEVDEQGHSLGKGNILEEKAAALVRKIASGEPTRGGFLLASHIPPFRAPPMVKLDSFAEYTPYNPGDFKPAQLNKKAAASPAAMLASTKRVGTAPGALGHRGPSVEQVSKPKGFGRPEAGALKAGLI